MPEWIIGPIVLCAILIAATACHYYVVYKRFHYICNKCSTSFTPTFIRSLFGINGGSTRMLKCPVCKKMQSVRMKKNDTGASS